MRIRAMIQSTATVQLTAEADDVAAARELHNTMPRGGRVIAAGVCRPSAVDELDGEGDHYQAAMATLRANVPEGWRILPVRSVE